MEHSAENRTNPFKWMIGLYAVLGTCAIAAWVWLKQSLTDLPSPLSDEGKTLLYNYNRTTHDIFLALLAITIAALTWRAYSSSKTSQYNKSEQTKLRWPNAFINFAKEHPLVLLLFSAYSVAMVNGTNWLYPELVGWYDGILDQHMLNNFNIRFDFYGETMLRNDYRFFPLAHQDLHVLSWFTAYVKIWILVSAAELFAIIIMAHRLIRRLAGPTRNSGLLLLISLLLLSAPATGYTFFQLIFAERILTLCFICYAYSYLHYQETGSSKSLYLTLIFALIGMFFKEVGILLFITPAIFSIVLGSSGFLKSLPIFPWKELASGRRLSVLKEWLQHYQLELWICSLLVIFLYSYVFLSYLPSLYHGKQQYSSGENFQFGADPRFWILCLYSVARIFRTLVNHKQVQILDGLNAAAFAYAGSLYALVGYDGTNYMAMPVQLVAVLDIAYGWTFWVAPLLTRAFCRASIVGGISIMSGIGFIALEHQGENTFFHRVQSTKTRQASWLTTIIKIDDITRDTKNDGKDVNLIFTKSWFNLNRHLDRLRYDRLIFLDPTTKKYTIIDGINKDEPYIPQKGDFLINIDQNGLDFLGKSLDSYDLIYSYSEKVKNGRIYRYSKSNIAD